MLSACLDALAFTSMQFSQVQLSQYCFVLAYRQGWWLSETVLGQASQGKMH